MGSTAGDEARESWGNYWEFFLTSLGLAVGLGNIWRFPYVAYTNGGGSFLIPYIIMLFVVGIPAFFVELSVGQYGRVGANKVYGRMSPAFKGLGYGMLFVRQLVNVYYVVICAWAFYYLFAGFQSDLPWSTCTSDDWNTYDCYAKTYNDDCDTQTEVYYNFTCTGKNDYCLAHEYQGGWSGQDEDLCLDGPWPYVVQRPLSDVLQDNQISPAEDYFNGKVLGLTKNVSGAQYDWNDYGSIQWEIALCLLLTWIVVCLILIKGIQSLGKAAYVITLSPYVVLTALIAYAATLPGAGDGIDYFLSPEWDKLTDINIWSNAASQILFSLSVGFGSQLILASYNEFHNNTHRDAILIGICNSLTSIYAGFVVFAILGFLADQSGTTVPNVVQGGISLAFVSYPSAVLEMDPPPFWSFLFFFMLINLALSSVCGGVQAMIAFVLDEKPSLKSKRIWIVIIMCCINFLLGLSMTTNGGIHLFTIFDDRCTDSLILITCLEVFLVAWVYGIKTFFKNLSEMQVWIPFFLKPVWYALLLLVTPGVLLVIAILSWVDHTDLAYNDYTYPDAVQAVGWFIELAPLGIVALYPIWSIYRLYQSGARGSELSRRLFSPTASWYNTVRISNKQQQDRRDSSESPDSSMDKISN